MFSRKSLAVAAATVAMAGLAFSSNVASASIDPVTTLNPVGEAGYVVNNTNWHIRFATTQFIVTAAMKDLNSTAKSTGGNDGTSGGGVGTEFCDNNTGAAAQTGLVYDAAAYDPHAPGDGAGTGFQIAAQFGYLEANPFDIGGGGVGNGDPCTSGGLVSQSTISGPHAMAAPVYFHLNGITINVGDVIRVSAYYSPGARYRTVKFAVADVTQNVTNQFTTPYIGWQTFYEAATGVINNNNPDLTAPAQLPLASFTNSTFTDYAGQGGSLNGGWDLKEVEAVNGASQVVLAPSALPTTRNWSSLDTAFTVSEGSVLPS